MQQQVWAAIGGGQHGVPRGLAIEDQEVYLQSLAWLCVGVGSGVVAKGTGQTGVQVVG